MEGGRLETLATTFTLMRESRTQRCSAEHWPVEARKGKSLKRRDGTGMVDGAGEAVGRKTSTREYSTEGTVSYN